MSPAVIRRCMEPYFSTKPPGVSAGMGLPFVYRLFTGSGGRVEIDSIVGQGTTVILKLRRAEPVEWMEPHAASHLPGIDSARRGSGLAAEA